MADEQTAEEAPPIFPINAPTDVLTAYADGVVLISIMGSTVRLQMVETILGAADSPTPGLHVKHVFNLVMPIEGYRNMLEYAHRIDAPSSAASAEAKDGK